MYLKISLLYSSIIKKLTTIQKNDTFRLLPNLQMIGLED